MFPCRSETTTGTGQKKGNILNARIKLVNDQQLEPDLERLTGPWWKRWVTGPVVMEAQPPTPLNYFAQF